MDWREKSIRMIALPRYYLRGLTKELYRRDVFLWAQAIGFKVLITVVPIIVLATGLAGALLRQQRPFSIIEGLIRDFLPSYQSDQIVNFLSQLQSASGTLTLIGAAAPCSDRNHAVYDASDSDSQRIRRRMARA